MPATEATLARESPVDVLGGRAGLTVPEGWWASAPLLKSLEAAGFGWVQVHAPPFSVLRSPRSCRLHASALRESLETTGLGCVLHAPASLRAGTSQGDRAFEGLLAYAAEAGAGFVVYHARALPDASCSEPAFLAEAASLAFLAACAERLHVTIAIENLTPVYPGPESVSANPMSLRNLVLRVGSDRMGICLDLGHAHITSELRHTSIERLCEPVLDVTCLFHLHDNHGARRRPARAALGVDPLRLDLHLPPGRGTLPWQRVAPLMSRHAAPLVMEIHPPYRARAAELYASLREALTPAPRSAAPLRAR